MDLEHFTDLMNKVKLHIKSKPVNKQKKLVLVNCDGVKLKLMPKSFSQRITKKNVEAECIIYCEKDGGKIISPRGTPLIYQELKRNGKLDIVKWSLEEFIIGKI